MSFSEIVANASDHSEAKQKKFNLKPITPEGIFSFACHPGVSCFNRCCHEIDVILTPVDILKIKTELNMSSDKFLTQYTTIQKMKGTGIPLVKLLMRENTNGAVGENPALSSWLRQVGPSSWSIKLVRQVGPSKFIKLVRESSSSWSVKLVRQVGP